MQFTVVVASDVCLEQGPYHPASSQAEIRALLASLDFCHSDLEMIVAVHAQNFIIGKARPTQASCMLRLLIK